MKRSIINKIIQESDEFIKSYGFRLPPFAYFQPSELVARKLEFQAIFDARLGWDITDYGEGRFNEKGLFLFTVRNGSMSDLRSGKGMCYAEKIMISRQDQVSPSHRHIIKTEDIINRGGGFLCIEMFSSNPQGNLDLNTPISFLKNSEQSILPAGSKGK